MLAGAARGEMGSKGEGGRVRLSDVDTWDLEAGGGESVLGTWHRRCAAKFPRAGCAGERLGGGAGADPEPARQYG